MWDSMTEVGRLKEDIALLTEYLPRLEAIYHELAGIQIEMASIRIDMDKRKSKPHKPHKTQ